MTNNDELKADAAELIKKLKNFKQKYRLLDSKTDSLASFEKDLRLILMVARTDEENKRQRENDSLC